MDDLGRFSADEVRRGLFQSQRVILPPEIKAQLETKDYVTDERVQVAQLVRCLLYTSDAADERSSVDLGGRRIIKKKKGVARDGGMYLTYDNI